MNADTWDSRYSSTDFAYGTVPNDFLVSVVDRLPRGPTLCLAEGEGRNAVFLATRGLNVTALDQSSVGLAKAAHLAQQKEVLIDTLVADLEHYTLEPRAWTNIIAIWCHLPQGLRKKVFSNAAKALKPGGAMVIESYTPRQLEYRTGGPPNRDMLPTLEDLKADLDGLELAHGVETLREIHEGRLHNGMSAVVQILAFKPC